MGKVRIDRWRWAARLFKTRSLAARAVRPGDILEITRGPEQFTVTILELAERRGPARVARTLYEESEQSILARMAAREERRLIRTPAIRPEGRPDKRDRRRIREFLRKD